MKNIDLVNSIIANRKGIHEAIVKTVNKYYWSKGVKKKLSTLDSNAVFIRNIGTIVVSRYNLRKIISKTIRQIKAIRISTKFKEETREIYLKELYKRLNHLLRSRNELAKKYNNECNKRISEPSTIGD